MRSTKILATAMLSTAVALPFIGVGSALAASGDATARLSPVALNGVKGSGTAMASVRGTTLTVTMAASGLLPDQPHAAHIHFGADARHECPIASDDADDSGTLTTTEGAPAYGPVVVSLTKTGDTSAKSVLAVDRYDTAPGGKLSYERGSIKVSPAVADAIVSGKAVVVIHGVDHDGDGKYGGDAKSDLNPDLPAEATDPALCGVLAAAPVGGAGTGAGGAAASDESLPLAAGAGILLLAAGSGALALRRARSDA